MHFVYFPCSMLPSRVLQGKIMNRVSTVKSKPLPATDNWFRRFLAQKTEESKNQAAVPDSFLKPIDETVTQIGFSGIVAGTFDYLGLEEIIDEWAGNNDSHAAVNTGAITKALVMQMLHAPYQTLYGTSEFFANIPVNVLLNLDIGAKDLSREMLGRYLDIIFDSEPDKLFVKLASAACKKTGVTVSEVHLDSTSFSYDGKAKSEDICEMEIARGYSRDHHQELPQVCLLGLTEGTSRMPVFTKAVSGNMSDKTSFLDVVASEWPMIREQFNDLKYLVGDSALCTPDILASADRKIFIVTRVPDTYRFVTQMINETKESDLTKVYDTDKEDQNYGCWGEIQKIGDIPVKVLLIKNLERKESKRETIMRRAEKELSKISAALKKLKTHPTACREDAERAVEKLEKSCRACVISDIQYTEIKKHKGKGRPKADAPMVVTGVEVTGKVSISEDYISRKVEEEIQFVIATTDTERQWTMAELLSTYKRQSTIERTWKLSKDPKIFLDAIYLKTPHRIQALMWILSVALLTFATTEYLMKIAMKENNIPMPAPDHRTNLAVPTLLRLKQYTDNSNINLIFSKSTREFKIAGLTNTFAQIITAMGYEWSKYYQTLTYETFYKIYCNDEEAG